MNIKKFLFILMTLVLVFSASACSSEGSSSEKQKSNTGKEETLPPIPKKVFSSNKTNQNISEKEMRQSLKTYLNTHDDIFKNAEKIRNKDNLTKKESQKLNKLTKLANENDDNFSKFIKNNDLPRGYKEGTLKTKNYITSTNQFLNKINLHIQKLNKNSESVDVSLEDANKINKINDQYKKEVNGKKQNEVEKFLKNKNIKTKAFK
ncbi:NDxxF motif lipoprotein [Staphylococcus cohnii]